MAALSSRLITALWPLHSARGQLPDLRHLLKIYSMGGSGSSAVEGTTAVLQNELHPESANLADTTHLIIFAHGLTASVTSSNLCHGIALDLALREMDVQGVELCLSAANAAGMCHSSASNQSLRVRCSRFR